MRAVSLAQDDARAWAVSFFAQLRTQRDPANGYRWLDAKDNRAALIDVTKALARQDVHRLLATIDEAEAGWDIAHEALRDMIIEAGEGGQVLPASLEAYRTKILRGYAPKVRSTQKAARWLRNFAITYCVESLTARFGLPATGAHHSACAVTAAAMRGRGAQILTHRAVEKIWNDFSPWVTRMHRLSVQLEGFTAKKPAD